MLVDCKYSCTCSCLPVCADSKPGSQKHLLALKLEIISWNDNNHVVLNSRLTLLDDIIIGGCWRWLSSEKPSVGESKLLRLKHIFRFDSAWTGFVILILNDHFVCKWWGKNNNFCRNIAIKLQVLAYIGGVCWILFMQISGSTCQGHVGTSVPLSPRGRHWRNRLPVAPKVDDIISDMTSHTPSNTNNIFNSSNFLLFLWILHLGLYVHNCQSSKTVHRLPLSLRES